MTEKFKESADEGNAFEALLTDLSRAFDYIDHTLLIVSPLSFKSIYSYYRTELSESKSMKILVIELILNLWYPRVLV